MTELNLRVAAVIRAHANLKHHAAVFELKSIKKDLEPNRIVWDMFVKNVESAASQYETLKADDFNAIVFSLTSMLSQVESCKGLNQLCVRHLGDPSLPLKYRT